MPIIKNFICNVRKMWLFSWSMSIMRCHKSWKNMNARRRNFRQKLINSKKNSNKMPHFITVKHQQLNLPPKRQTLSQKYTRKHPSQKKLLKSVYQSLIISNSNQGKPNLIPKEQSNQRLKNSRSKIKSPQLISMKTLI